MMLRQSHVFSFFILAGGVSQRSVVVQSFVPTTTTKASFQASPSGATPFVAQTRLKASEDSTTQQQQTTTNNNSPVNGAGLVWQGGDGDTKSQLFASFAALSLSDQYDAVLTGLCAKILDAADLNEQAAVSALQDPLQLIQEMNDKKIPASARSLMALVDVRC